MIRLTNILKNQLTKIKRYLSKQWLAITDNQSKKIEIKSRYDSFPANDQNIATENTPKITIRGINYREPIASGTDVDGSETNTNLGRGMTVKNRRKPGKCPLCATRGGIIANPGGPPQWKCPTCDSTFN